MEGPGYLAVAIQPGPDTNDEAFHDWYNTEHGPLRLRLPFITSGDRYKALDQKQPEWSAVYDVSDLSFLDKRIYSRLREERSKREKQVMGTFSSLDRKIYKSISTVGTLSHPAPVILAFSCIINESDLPEFNTWYEEEHTPMLHKVPGLLRVRRFQMLVGGIKGMPPAGQVEMLSVHDYLPENGLDGPEHIAASNTPKTKEILSKLHWYEQRRWTHHLTFDALDEPPSSVITTDGAHLRFQLEGDPSAPVIVFVNSILTNFHIWDEVTHRLTTTGLNGKPYRVLRYNSRGYSQQDPKSNDTRFDLLASDLEYLLSRLNIPKVHAVVGVSMGGVTAINFAVKFPSLLEKFVACDCNVASSPANSTAWGERIQLAKEKGMGELADVTVKRWFTEANHGSREFVKTREMVVRASLEGFVQNTGALCNYDLKEDVKGIKVNGLLVAGDGDGKLPEVMKGFGIPGAEFKVVEGAGHLPMLENLDGFLKVLEGFL